MVAMAPASSTATEIHDIQRQMAQIRHDLHEEVREAVTVAQTLTDWRSFVRNHPWVTLGAAAAVGYLIVPRRRSAPTVVALSPPASRASLAVAEPASPAQGSRWGLLGTAVRLLAPIAVRAAQNYAVQYLEQWLEPPSGGRAETGSGTRPGGGARPAAPAGPSGRTRDLR
jgi:hypothetical protein